MQTEIWTASDEDLKKAGQTLKNGGLVAFPTETVYGLGADALNEKAVKAVYAAKGRPSDNPMIVHIHSVSQIGDLTPSVSEAMKILAADFWPGALTMVVPKAPCIPDATTGGLDSVGLRLPSSEAARRLFAFAGCPIAAPSANLSGSPSPTTWQRVRDDLFGRIDGIVMGEPCEIGIESTVVDLTGEIPTILRPGYITRQELENSLAKIGKTVEIDEHIKDMQDLVKISDRKFAEKGELGLANSYANKANQNTESSGIIELIDDTASSDFKPKAPGMKYKHYAPKADLILILGDYYEVAEKMKKMQTELEATGKKVKKILLSDSEEDIKLEMNTFFEKLREFDEKGADVILARGHSQENGRAYAIMNRMLKAAGYKVLS